MSSQNRENAMKIAGIISVGAAAFVVMSSAAFAEQARTGILTEVNRLNNTVAIRQTQNGTVGANTSGAAEAFKVGSGVSLEALHAGDSVSFSASGADGAKTITKIDRR
jgi:Cu/Ag efflux protein CusF